MRNGQGWRTMWFVAWLLGAWIRSARAEYVWWEAESPSKTNFPNRSFFSPGDAKEAAVLSGGQWISIDKDRAEPAFLEYAVEVPKEGTYSFYARKFWKHGPFRWRFDEQAWGQCTKDVALLDDAFVRQFVGANWVFVGAVKLRGGKHTMRLELTENKGAAAFDCFLLTTDPFLPRGKLKPGEKWNTAPEGWFAFEPDLDAFPAAGSPIDLRGLNEKYAGEGGFIVVQGDQFIHANTKQPVRFWACDIGLETVRQPRAAIDYLARHYAKLGINMVRLHGALWKGNDYTQIDAETLDGYFYLISALKKEGIYCTLSIYFPLWLDLAGDTRFPGYGGKDKNAHPFSLLFFHPEFQQIYRGWWNTILTTKNPYTGVALNQEPAVACVEIVNEDGNLFWTFSPANIPPLERAVLEKQFGDWLTAKYGNVAAAFAKWGGKAVAGDDAAAGRAGFISLWDIFTYKTLRGQDTATFLTANQMTFFQKTVDYLKKDLSFKASVYASNWTTANAQILGPLDKYSNTVADFMDRHGYFGGPHAGPRSGYALSNGDTYQDRSALLFTAFDDKGKLKPGEHDFSLPLWDIKYGGKPSTITEVNWTPPNRFRAEFPVLAAAYGLLQGTNAFYFFASGDAAWPQTLSKFSVHTPACFGQFPATAFLFRKGLLQTGPLVADVHLKVADLQALKGSPIIAPQNLDEFRAKDIPPGKTLTADTVASLDPLACAVGRVQMTFGEKAGPSAVMELSKFIDRKAETIRSATGELLWNYEKGLVTINAPQVQGATGFLAKAAPIKLGDITIETPLEYGAVLAVALDGQPLKSSGKILLQVMSEETNYSWTTSSPTGVRTVTDIGRAPLIVRNLAGTVSLSRPDAKTLSVVPLDFNGYRVEATPTLHADTINLRPATLYYLIQR